MRHFGNSRWAKLVWESNGAAKTDRAEKTPFAIEERIPHAEAVSGVGLCTGPGVCVRARLPGRAARQDGRSGQPELQYRRQRGQPAPVQQWPHPVLLVRRHGQVRHPHVAAAEQGRCLARGKPLDDYVQTKVDNRSVCLTPDLRYPQYLFFATKKDRETKNFDIYVAVRQNARSVYTAPTPINAVDTDEDEKDPWLSFDLRRLYFSRKTKEGWRVLVSSRQATTGAAGFREPVLLKDLPPGFHHATLTRDGKTMYLQGPLEKGRWGLFVSKNAEGKWSKPEPLPINNDEGPIGDVSPSLSRDGSLLYFASDRPGGKGKMDLWVIPTAKLKKK